MGRRLRLPVVPSPVRWGGVAAVAGVILLFSVVDPAGTGVATTGPLGLVGTDKWLHLAAYAGLAGSVGYALVESPARTALLLAVAGAAAYGFGIELVQAGLPYRSFDPTDAAVNGLGGTLGGLAWTALRRALGGGSG